VADVRAALRASGVESRRLGLEITETALMEGGDDVRQRLFGLKELGVRLLLDDFGTGYSSLSYLHRLPDRRVEDRRLVRAPARDRLAEGELVRTIVLIGKNLDKQVVAEGVETAAQAERLKALECAYGQGYFWSPPIEASAVPAVLQW